MKKLVLLLIAFALPLNMFSQKRNTLECTITFLPTLSIHRITQKFDKEKATQIDILLSLKSLNIKLVESDFKILDSLLSLTNFKGEKIYSISTASWAKIKHNQSIDFDLKQTDSISKTRITDLLSSIVDGSPFSLKLKTKAYTFNYESNFSAPVELLGKARPYIIYYFVLNDFTMQGKESQLIKGFFQRKRLLQNAVYWLSIIDQTNDIREKH
jgi:hypothetical protein